MKEVPMVLKYTMCECDVNIHIQQSCHIFCCSNSVKLERNIISGIYDMNHPSLRSRASNEGSRRFHNHIITIESAY